MLQDSCRRSDGLELNGIDDVAIHHELDVCPWMIGCLKDACGNIIGVDIFGMYEQQLVLNAFDVGGHATKLVRT